MATAYGVVGGVSGAMEAYGGVAGKRVLVHGTGQVGACVAKELASLGALVQTYDILPERADVEGIVENQSHLPERDFLTQECDVLVPCSCSNIVDTELAMELKCQVLAGASNLPFRNAEARHIIEGVEMMFVPESITSAGAIILDSVEMYDNASYLEAEPAEVYHFVAEIVRLKAVEFVKKQLDNYQDSLQVAKSVSSPDGVPRLGTLFSDWRAAQNVAPKVAAQSKPSVSGLAGL